LTTPDATARLSELTSQSVTVLGCLEGMAQVPSLDTYPEANGERITCQS
jgi:hypothetical protein